MNKIKFIIKNNRLIESEEGEILSIKKSMLRLSSRKIELKEKGQLQRYPYLVDNEDRIGGIINFDEQYYALSLPIPKGEHFLLINKDRNLIDAITTYCFNTGYSIYLGDELIVITMT